MADDDTVGYRFHPTDEELISHYLKNKMLGNLSLVRAIPEVEIYKCEPWDLPQKSEIRSDDLVWYFFCGKDYSGKRASRTTKGGFWKATGRDRRIKGKGSNREIGTKKTLVFHEGRVPKGRRTNWVIHEYHSAITVPNQRVYVICKLKKKAGEKTGISSGEGSGEPSRPSPSDIENQSARITTPEIVIQAQDNLETILDEDAFELVRSFIQSEDGISLSDLQYGDGFGNLDNNVLQSQLVITDEEQEFVNSMFADQYESTCDETVYNALPNDYRPEESLTGVHRKNSSDTEAETTYASYNKNLGPSSLIGGIAGSSKAGNLLILEGGFSRPVSNSRLISTTTRKSRYEPEMLLNPYDATESNKGEEPLERVAVAELTKLKNIKSSKKMVGESMRRKSSTVSNKEECFSFLEITHIIHEPRPPSFYIGNIVIGVTLLIFCVGEFMCLRS